MNTSRNKFSNRSDSPAFDEDRPQWQRDRGERYGNRRKEVARLKWKDQRRRRNREKMIDFE